MLEKLIGQNKVVYCTSILLTGVVSCMDALTQTQLGVEKLSHLISWLPLYGEGLAWLVPAAVGTVVGIIIVKILNREPRVVLEE